MADLDAVVTAQRQRFMFWCAGTQPTEVCAGHNNCKPRVCLLKQFQVLCASAIQLREQPWGWLSYSYAQLASRPSPRKYAVFQVHLPNNAHFTPVTLNISDHQLDQLFSLKMTDQDSHTGRRPPYRPSRLSVWGRHLVLWCHTTSQSPLSWASENKALTTRHRSAQSHV
jgi:hypothetical protein